MSSDIISLLAPLLQLIVIDLIVGLVAFLLLGILSKSKRAAYAVLKRNFLGYFSNPTGYVFLCLFVLLTSMAAFWPHEFFNSNLANLDQLNYWLPVIMLFFIPAITMSIWADEKRQGTDELLLTLPADDFDIVIGKYLSAASIYTVSLLFSQVSTFLVLLFLSNGELDAGLFLANYLGYWFIGLAMLAIGMIASFLTSNLTVGFILGALFNAPLVFASMSDVIFGNPIWAQSVSMFSIQDQFDNFGRGVISIAPIAFFSLVLAFGLYFCMVLIGRRHWSGGADGNTKFLHYLFRVILLLGIVFTVSYFLHNNDRPRYDATHGQVSSLSPMTKNVIRQLSPDRPIVIDAFISSNIPEQYAKTRYDLISLLKEFRALASSRKVKLQVQINDNIDPSSETAIRAEKQYGIRPQQVRVRERGAFKDQEIMLGAAVRSGLSKVVIPFFESGIPVEYELVRSIDTVAQPKRRSLGVVKTDANFMGGFSMAGGGFQQLPKQPIIDELEKQFDVEEVDPSSPISTTAYDALLVPQPSSLNPQQLPNVVNAILAGVPTAIFEDPMPAVYQGIPGTGQPKPPQGGGMMGMGGQSEPKGDMQPLWNALGIEVPQTPGFAGINPDIVWQQFNPHPKLQYLANANNEWLFIMDSGDGGDGGDGDYLNDQSKITDGLRELMFLYAGAVKADDDRKDLKVTELVRTRGDKSGRIKFEDLENNMRSGASASQLQLLEGPALEKDQAIAVLIEGIVPDAAKGKDGESEAEPTQRPIRAVYVADIDYMHEFFSENRKSPEQFEDLDLRVQNITFVLNIVDVLVGEENYPTIRSHEPKHVTLALFEEQAEEYRLQETQKQKEFQENYDKQIQETEEEDQRAMAAFEERLSKLQKDGAVDPSKFQELQGLMQQMAQKRAVLARKQAIKREVLASELAASIQESRRQAERKVLDLQSKYKMLAIFLPPLPPLLLGAGVFVTRRVREREGIAKNRLR